MGTVYFLLYWTIAVVLISYVTSIIIALIATAIVVAQAEMWEVDTTDPMNKTRKVIRRVEPFEIIVVTKGGKPIFPVIDMNEKRLTVKGLIDSDGGLDNEKPGQWKVIQLPEKDANGNKVNYPEIIQSRWGWLSPLYIFRKLVFSFTQRHVVRVLFPFFIAGFYELYSPHTMKFVRARAKKEDQTKVGRGSMVVLDDVYESQFQIVQDSTDHLLYISPMRFITNTMPTKDGFSLRADVTIMVKVIDPFQIVSLKDWSQQLVSAVDNALSQVFRTGSLDTVYAVSDPTKVNLIQQMVKEQLTEVDKVIKDVSLMEYLGFEFVGITLNDLIPADAHAKTEIERIMAILTEGRKNAESAGLLLQEQVARLTGVSKETIDALASITAAQNSKGKIDWIMNTGGGSSDRGETDKAMLAFLKRIENKK